MIQLEKEQFSMLAGAIPFAAKEEEYRRYLSGVFFEFNGETCSIVATDMTSLSPDYLGAVSKSYSAIARRLKIEIKQVALYFFGETGAVRISGLSVFAPAFDYLVMPMRIRIR